jgi:DNA-binding NarL/FixJ family response regulator
MSPRPDLIRIVIADDHPVLRKGLKQVIEEDPSLRVAGEAGDGDAAVKQIEELQPEIAVLDINMPGLDGFAVLRAIQERRLPTAVIFLTLHADQELFDEAMNLGAQGYIIKDTALTAIVEGIRTVAAGRPYVTPSLTALMLRRRSRAEALTAREPRLEDLTPTERRILRMIANSQTSKEIAETLSIHYRTVENHRVNIAQKLGLQGHNAVLKFALLHKSAL